jgi:RNA polymerase sigma factor (sigma-70 family)
MSEAGTTRASLLVRIRDCDDDQAWSQFVEIYAPLVYGFARRHGLQDADASDLTQDVLQSVARAARTLDYDPARGSFRGWLFTIVRNKLRDLVGRCGRQVRGTGDTRPRGSKLAGNDCRRCVLGQESRHVAAQAEDSRGSSRRGAG